jgi:hypothetical protein
MVSVALFFWGFLVGAAFFIGYLIRERHREQVAKEAYLAAFESEWEAFVSDKEFAYLGHGEGIALDMKNRMVYFTPSESYLFSEIRSGYYSTAQRKFFIHVKNIYNPERSFFMFEEKGKQWEEIFRQYVFRY